MSTTKLVVAGNPNFSLSYFGDADVEFFRRSVAKLVVHEQDPAIVEVEDCVVPPGKIEGSKRSGVYDRNGILVAGSARARGGAARVPDEIPEDSELRDAVQDSRTAYYLGRGAGHFGHFLLETFCRAWGWERYGPDRVPLLQTAVPDFAHSMYRLISPQLAENIEVVPTTTRFANVLVPHPGFVLKSEAFLAYKQLCVRMAERVAWSRGNMSDQPVYLSRSGLNSKRQRSMLGEERLERLLEAEGVRVVRPETLPIPDQIALFNTHQWIIAPMGSACHGRLFATRKTSLIMLCRNRLTPNLPLCDSLSEGPAFYVNVLSGLSEKFRYDEPLVLHEERLLHFLKEMGLVRHSAAFNRPDHELIAGKQQWLRTAKREAKSRSDNGLLQAIAEVEASLR